jgi:1-acyl-sn-glycerol-3-phosphate acyltransferase
MTARAGDRVMAKLARLLTRAFFRRIDVEGTERMPAGPVVLVANHVNGLVDGLVLMATLPRYPRFLGKTTLYRILPLAPFLHLAGVVPVHRTKDAGGATGRATERNDAAFRTCRALLASGGLVAVFPEGISHDEARVQPLRTGAARIALGAAFDDGVPGIETVAVGLVYDDKARFRSRALVRIGEPEGVGGRRAGYERDPVGAVRSLTDEIGRQLARVAPMYESRQQELAFRRVACVVSDSPAGQDDVSRALGAACANGPAAAARVTALTDAAEAYEADLALVGLSDDHVAAGLTASRYRRHVGRSVVAAAATAPLAAFGAVVHAVPYGIMKHVGERPANEGMRATVKLLGCTVLFTAVYASAGIAVGRRRGLLAGMGAFVLGPLSGYVTVRWVERMHRLGGIARARAVMAERRDLVADLQQQRAGLIEAATALVSAPAPAVR